MLIGGLAMVIVGILLTVSISASIPAGQVGMSEEEFVEVNKNHSIYKNSVNEFIIIKDIISYNEDENEWNRNNYIYTFQKDTLKSVHRGIFNLYIKKQVDYNKFATPLNDSQANYIITYCC